MAASGKMVKAPRTAAARVPGRPDLNRSISSMHWQELIAAAATDRVAELVAAMYADADTYTDRAVRRILHKVGGGYEDGRVVERDDLWWSVHRNLETVLLALAHQRPLDEGELAVRCELGRTRARQGMPLDDVMRAYRVGYTTLWEALSTLAGERGPEFAVALLERAAHVWMTFDQVTSAVAEAYQEVLDTQHLDHRRRALALLTGLQRYPEDAERTEQIARSLGLDPNGSYTVTVQDPLQRSPDMARDIVVIEQPDRFVVVAATRGEPSRAEATLAGFLRRRRFCHVGVGVMRRGLVGAQQSLCDAELAHELAVAFGASAVLYRENWLACLALRHHDQLDVLVAPAVQALGQDEDLLQTFEAFLAADGNLTAAAKALYVHANTVGYRLRQFTERSGIDPRTASGMALIQVALTYAQLSEPVSAATS